jgi:transcriptional regulator with XRE-family HTH domain
MTGRTASVGEQLRSWRHRRRFSQLDLACEAGISTRHLSFLETGRSTPSRDMVLHLAEQLDVPLRDRNALLLAAGFAPLYAERSLDDPEMRFALGAVKRLLRAHEPFPALAVDRHWTLIAANRAIEPLLVGVSPALLQPPLNVLRLGLHPDGIARRIMNFHEWREHLLSRLRRQVESSADPVLTALLQELSSYPERGVGPSSDHAENPEIAVPLRLTTDMGVLSFLSTTMVFGAPLDVTLSELAIEIFLPADAHSDQVMRRLVADLEAGTGCEAETADGDRR